MKIKISLLLLLWSAFLCAANYKTVSGYITNEATGETLIGATVYSLQTDKGVVTNGYGFYSIQLPEGDNTLVCSYMGHRTVQYSIQVKSDTVCKIALPEAAISLEDVVVTQNLRSVRQQNEFNAEVLTVQSIRKLPTLFGEADVIKAIQMQSGVQSLGDGSAGMFVRGGSSDQNLIVIDEAPIYNASHLYGMVSIFNPDAVNSVTLYKSNAPAQYGGRVSSVLDCQMKEGNRYKHNFSFSVSPFAATLTANGPIVKEKSSFFLSARHSLIDWFVQPSKGTTLVPGFYDVNAKVSTQLGSRDKLFVSFYSGRDVIESYEGLHNVWGNMSGTLRWNHNFAGKWFLNLSFIASDYKNRLRFTERQKSYEWNTGVFDLNLKANANYYVAHNSEIQMGVGTIRHHFTPGESNNPLTSIARIEAFEHSAYVLHDWSPLSWLGVNYGVHFSAFQPMSRTDNTHVQIEPRVSANIGVGESAAFKVAYARNAQYMQVLQNSSLSYTSLETWFPAVKGIKPVLVNTYTAGWFQQIGKQFSASAELYYKLGKNQIDYIDHARLIENPTIETEVRSGTSTAYGVEVNIRKESGPFTGGVSYTYARVLYRIAGINEGKQYSALSDIPHNIQLTGHYQFTPRWSVSAYWQYASGKPVTLPAGFYNYLNQIVPVYTSRNTGRVPDYHRLDVSCSYTSPIYKGGFNWSTSFGLYNAYNRHNPMSYTFDIDYEAQSIKVNQFSLFGLLPNVSVKVHF